MKVTICTLLVLNLLASLYVINMQLTLDERMDVTMREAVDKAILEFIE